LKLNQLMLKYTSTVVMSGFLGMNSMKEQLKDESIQTQILRLSDMGMALSIEFLPMVFGVKFLARGWRQKDRDYHSLKTEINEVLQSYINKYRQEAK
jgi:hypothetical protein